MIVRPSPVSPAVRAARRAAFTLVELLAVMAIIMVLAGLGAFAVVSQMDKARRNEAYIQMSKIENAAKQYYIANGTWPASVMDLVQQQPDGSAAPLEGGLAAVTDPWKGQYSGGPQLDAAGVERYVVTCTTSRGEVLTWPKQ
jgi:general secretion pathway protein G